MTTKEFELLAEAFQLAKAHALASKTHPKVELKGVKTAAYFVAKGLQRYQKFNNRFDASSFLAACGMG